MNSQLLINEPPLQVLPTLAKIIGLNEAIVLQQIHYWLHPQVNKNYFGNRYWVYNTYGQWQKQFPFFSERTLRRTVKNLEASGFILSCKGGELNQTKFYTINYDSLRDIFCTKPEQVILKGIHQHPPTEEDPSKLKQLCRYTDINVPEEAFDTRNQKADARHQPSNPLSPSMRPGMERKDRQHPLELAKNNVIYPTWTKRPDRPDKMATPSGQSGQVIRPKWPHPPAKMTTPPGQFGHHTYTENTTENTSENILPPLLPVFQGSARGKAQEEKEDKKIYFEFENTARSSEQNQHPTSNNAVEGNKKGQEMEGQHPTEHQFFSEMLETWNQTVQKKLNTGQDVRLTNRRKASFKQWLQEVCLSTNPSEKLEAWQDYCRLIAKSRFLTGHNSSGFKVTLDWALIPNNAYKVLEGAIYDKPEPAENHFKKQSWEAFSEELARTFPSTPYLQPWIKISIDLAKLIGQFRYKSWFSKVSLKELTETKAVFAVEGDFSRDYVAANFSSEIRCAVQSSYPGVEHIDFQAVPPAGGLA